MIGRGRGTIRWLPSVARVSNRGNSNHRMPSGAEMRRFAGPILAIAVLSLGVASSQASTITVTIPDPSPASYIFFGTGNASVTYSGVVFSQQAALSNGNFYNVGVLFSGDPAVLSSQAQTIGVANILVTLPTFTAAFSVNYGTFNGSAVTFALSNGFTTTLGSTGSGYVVPDFFSYSGTVFDTVQITSPDIVLNINNITYNVPEPGTLAMLGTSVLVAAGGLRRRYVA